MQVMRFQISLSHFLWCAKFFDAFLSSETEVLINFFSCTFQEWLMWDAEHFWVQSIEILSGFKKSYGNSLRWNFLYVNSHLLWWTGINFYALLRFNLYFLMTMMTYSLHLIKKSCVVRILITQRKKKYSIRTLRLLIAQRKNLNKRTEVA